MPSTLLRQPWQWSVLTRRRQPLQPQELQRLVDAWDTRYRPGVGTHVPQGAGPARSESLARYRAQDVVRPPLARRRLDGEDGPQVLSHSRAHTSARGERETGDVDPCLGRLLPHGCAKGCQRLRDDGGQATKTFAQRKGLRREAVAKVTGGVRGAVKSRARRTARPRAQQRSARAPLLGPQGHHAMARWKVGHRQEGVGYDELEAINKGKDGSRGA